MKSALGLVSMILVMLVSPPARSQPEQAVVTEVVIDKSDAALLRIEFKAKVHLADFKLKKGKKSITVASGLSGEVRAIITNTSKGPVVIEDLEVANLVFVDPKKGTEYVMVHPCAVMSTCGPDQNQGRRLVTLAPGQAHEATVDEFGCAGSMWKAPPPGLYQLRYRLRISPPDGAPVWCGPDGNRPAHESVAAARKALVSEKFWQGSVFSDPIEVDLRKTRTEWVE